MLCCVKAEEFQSSARQLLDWLSNAERSLRYQTPPMPDSEEQLEDHLAQLEVPVLLSVSVSCLELGTWKLMVV